jgi:hypothetical protein
MSEMVERVAKAIEKGIADLDLRGPGSLDYPSVARVVMEAMREPTDAMAKAGSNTIDEKMPDAKALRQVLYIWADMIDEALK